VRQVCRFVFLWILLSLYFTPVSDVCAGPQPAVVDEAPGPALQFLNRFPEINIVFTYAPGNGHFASTKLVMDRVRELGYNGKFHIYIDNRIRDKVYHFLPGYNPKGDLEQTLTHLNADTRGLDVANNWYTPGTVSPVSQVLEENRVAEVKTLAIAGGMDARFSPSFVNSDALLVVQPTGWKTPVLRLRKQDAWDSDFYDVELDHQRHLKLKDIIPTPKNPAEFIEAQMQGVDNLAVKIPGLKTIANAIDQHEILTAYGISYLNGPTKLATILSGINEFQLKKASELKRGVVVPMISNFNEEEWTKFYSVLPEKYHSKVKVLSVADPALKETLETMAGDEITVVKAGSVTQNVWNYLMSKSTYPPMASGTTGGSYLGNLGKPFFNTANHWSGTDQVTHVHTESFFNAVNKADLPAIETYFEDARNPTSQLSKDFRAYSEKVLLGTEKVEGILNHISTDTCFVSVLKSMVPPEVHHVPLEVEALVETLSAQ
jgi:hypothetical protein